MPTFCGPMDCSPPGSSVHGILQARILEWVAMPPADDLPDPGIEAASPVPPSLAGGFFITEPPDKPDSWTLRRFTKMSNKATFV